MPMSLRWLPLFAFVLTCLGAGGPPQEDPRIARIEKNLKPLRGENTAPQSLAERMKHYKAHGVSIAVIDGGQIAWAKGYGVTDKVSGTPVTAATLFQAASISKPVAAIAALKLVEQGKLNLEEDVNVKLRAWKVPENEFTMDQKVTLRRLLSHTAGLTVHGFPGYAPGKPVPTVPQILNGEPPANTKPVRVDVVPGSRWRYSGGGYTVLQLLVTEVTGQPYAEFLRTTVLEPAGMKDSTFEQPLPDQREAQAAKGHLSFGNVVPGRWHTYPEQAAAGLWTTPSDLARLTIALQDAWNGRSERLLTQETARRMLTHEKGGFGLGWMVAGTGPTLRFRHGGRNEGFDCLLMAKPATGQGAVIMVNGNVDQALLQEILASIASEYRW